MGVRVGGGGWKNALLSVKRLRNAAQLSFLCQDQKKPPKKLN